MGQSEKRCEDGRKLRDRLKAEGRREDAEIVAGLVKSMTGSRTALKTLHRDNAALWVLREQGR